jgi:hypothetical protein
MSVYRQILDIAQAQAAAAACGDLEQAAELIDQRAALIDGAPPASGDDAALVREIMRLDAALSSAFSLRMLALRDEARATQRGQTALGGYRPRLRVSALTLDAAR